MSLEIDLYMQVSSLNDRGVTQTWYFVYIRSAPKIEYVVCM